MPSFEQTPASVRAAAADLLARTLRQPAVAPRAAPHLRNGASCDALLDDFVLASLPAFAVGAWASGTQLAALAAHPDAAGWQVGLARLLGTEAAGAAWPVLLALGLLAAVPLIVTSAVTAAFWEALFAAHRRRPVDAGWPMLAWLFALLLPVTTPLVFVVVGMSFAAVLGKHVFGGTGRYLVSPALLGAVFLSVAYPAALATDVPASLIAWSRVAGDGIEGTGWLAAFSGLEQGALGTPSALACCAGAAFLWLRGAASARTMLGALAGLVVAAALLNLSSDASSVAVLGGHWHLALGQFAFVAAFVATDPTISPLTRLGRWLYGALFGGLTVAIRALGPGHPEASVLAALLASLCVPLIDHVVLALTLRRAAARPREWPRRG